MTTKKMPWTPWKQVVQLREDLRSGELSLAIFAADLYDVVMERARAVYKDPAEFFALTYPTFNLRALARDVMQRLDGKSDKAVRQLSQTYGGGKTHTLITLYHLTRDPAHLPDLPAVREFVSDIGGTPPRSRVGVLTFDKLDVERGMEVKSPDGKQRWLKHPWSVLAFQLAGEDGLKLLHADGKAEERDSAPAENLLVDLLARPGKEGLGTLLLIDEVLMYATEKVGMDEAWQPKLVNFFQYLTQAATKVDRCAIVASLLASDPAKSSPLGKRLQSSLSDVFSRGKEENVQPVTKDDVAEVLRRRFFTPDSTKDRDSFRAHTQTAVRNLSELDEATEKDKRSAEQRLLASYPFHPDLTEVFYSKWTQLEAFQRTRGILRTFALALRDADRWDEGPLVSVNVLLPAPGQAGLSQAARELVSTAGTEEYEGKKQEWAGILEGELKKAQEIQTEIPGLKWREAEQAVMATFLHSQPIGQKAQTRDLMLLCGATRPDKIEMEKALRRWAEVSWFLDEAAAADAEARGDKKLPKFWRLGSRPNLKQMHHDACARVQPETIEHRLLQEIEKQKLLKEGVSGSGARLHVLPERPRDIEDDGEFHFAVLGPKAASDASRPSEEAKRFLNEHTSADRPRTCRNAVVLVAPAKDGLDLLRQDIRAYLGWEEVKHQLRDQEMDPVRKETLDANIDLTRKKIPQTLMQAYSVVVAVGASGQVEAYRLAPGEGALFARIVKDERIRIQTSAVNAEALLPGGPYNLWHDGETARRVKDLVGAFAEKPNLPKMLNRQAIFDTLVQGLSQGLFVMRTIRADQSARTFYRQTLDEVAEKDPTLELVLPEAATITELSPALIEPGKLPGLWSGKELSLRALASYFAGGHVEQIQREGYTEPMAIPKAERSVLDAAISAAVSSGALWLRVGTTASLWREDIPAGLLNNDGTLLPRPQPIDIQEILPARLPAAWTDDDASAQALLDALSAQAGVPLPLLLVRDAIEGAVSAGLLEKGIGSPWPIERANLAQIHLRIPKRISEPPTPPQPPPPTAKPGRLYVEAEVRLDQLQDLAEQLPNVLKQAKGLDLRMLFGFEVRAAQPDASKLRAVNDIVKDISPDLVLPIPPK